MAEPNTQQIAFSHRWNFNYKYKKIYIF